MNFILNSFIVSHKNKIVTLILNQEIRQLMGPKSFGVVITCWKIDRE